jgi:hypothetical protein
MIEFMHQVLMKVSRVVVQIAHYIVLSSNEVSTIDNQSWLFVRDYYVVKN